jgi:phenylacetate-coenzyme A ligase PaaK-like adenylate-forming protein
MHRLGHALMICAAVPRRVWLFEKLRRRVGWSMEQIEEYQRKKLRDLISYCWEYVPYYRSSWKGSIAGPHDIRSFEDLVRLPILTKAEVREHGDSLVSTAPWVRKNPARTGGSTGSPVIFHMTDYDEQLAWAQMYLGWSWAGYRLGDPFLVVGGESIGVGLSDKRSRKDSVVNRWVTSGSNLNLDRARALAESPHFARVRMIYGYPNSIRELCEHFATLGVRPPALQGVVCTAEVMRPEVRKRIAELLGVSRVLDQYGLNDGGLHACEGREQDGLHLSFHRGILEILDDRDRQITALKQSGRAIATTLTNQAMPFVRYETGDAVHWHSREPSPSGVSLPRIGPVEGRTGDVIYLPSGRSIPMPGLTLVMRWLDGLKSYQFIQTDASSVTVRLDRGADFKLGHAEVVAFLRQRIAEDIRWSVAWGAPELTVNGKLLIIRNDWLRQQGLTRPP